MFSRLSGLAAIYLLLSSPIFAQSTANYSITPQQFFDMGVAAMRDDNPQEAAQVADALLRRNPDDPSALILRTEAAVNLQDYAGAISFGRAAYYATSNDNQRFAAARLVALAHSQLAQDSRAQLWLRRARQYAPNDQTARKVAEDYQFLRSRNPWSTQLRFGVTPTNNINNGSAKTQTELFGLPFLFELDGEARALSGTEIMAGVSSLYRIIESRTAATFITMSADLRSYAMSADAKKQAPNAKGSDFSFATVTFGANHKRILSKDARPTDFNIKAGQTWYGGDIYARFIDGSVSQSWQLDENDTLTGAINMQRRVFASDTPDTRSAGIFARWGHSFKNRDQFAFAINARKNKSNSSASDYDAITYSVDYDFSKPVYGLRLGLGLDFEQNSYDASSFAPGPRKDHTTGLRVSLELTQVELYGFRPVVDLQMRRNESTIDLFDRDYGSIGFDLRSSF